MILTKEMREVVVNRVPAGTLVRPRNNVEYRAILRVLLALGEPVCLDTIKDYSVWTYLYYSGASWGMSIGPFKGAISIEGFMDLLFGDSSQEREALKVKKIEEAQAEIKEARERLESAEEKLKGLGE